MTSPREYSKPTLIVLGRGAPEENVLCFCKTRPGYGSTHSGCGHKEGCIIKQNSGYSKS
jgi:hypothetical protein